MRDDAAVNGTNKMNTKEEPLTPSPQSRGEGTRRRN